MCRARRRRDGAGGDGRGRDRGVGVSDFGGRHTDGGGCVDDESGGGRLFLAQGVCCRWWLSWFLGSSSSVENFSIGGDGLTTATTAEAGVSAVVALAAHATYTGSVLVAQTMAENDEGFWLFQVILCGWYSGWWCG